MNTPTGTTNATGPTTPEGKRVAARNATTHGLFARDVVLPHLGEDPRGYEALLAELAAQLGPKNLLERHYVEKIAAASWRLRRLHRWQAQLFEDPNLAEEEALARLDRVMRHETALHRQIDTSIKMLARELPKLFEGRVRADLIKQMNGTERECREDPAMGEWITAQTRQRVTFAPVPPGLDLASLDAAPVPIPDCQNEPATVLPTAASRVEGAEVPRPPRHGEGDRLAGQEGFPATGFPPSAEMRYHKHEPRVIMPVRRR